MKKKVRKSRTGSEAAQFDQKTIQEFKEAFGIMDQNKDGVIDKNDLKDLYAMMGSVASDSQIDTMLKEAPGPINFTVFLTLFGERLTGLLFCDSNIISIILKNRLIYFKFGSIFELKPTFLLFLILT